MHNAEPRTAAKIPIQNRLNPSQPQQSEEAFIGCSELKPMIELIFGLVPFSLLPDLTKDKKEVPAVSG